MGTRSFLKTTWLNYSYAIAVELTYRVSFAQTVLSEIIGMMGVVMFWLAALAMTHNEHYTVGMLVTYFLVAGLHNIFSEDHMGFNLSFDIRSGKLATSLLRPYPFMMTPITRAMAFVTVRGVILFPLVFGTMAMLPSTQGLLQIWTLEHAVRYLLTLILALAAGWSIKTALGLLAFYMTQTWGPELIYISIASVASGEKYPPDLLPLWLQTVVSWTPVYYMVGFPSLTFLGRLSADEWCHGFARGACVVLCTALLARLLWQRGMRQFEAVGI